jgi:hypothetical protein
MEAAMPIEDMDRKMAERMFDVRAKRIAKEIASLPLSEQFRLAAGFVDHGKRSYALAVARYALAMLERTPVLDAASSDTRDDERTSKAERGDTRPDAAGAVDDPCEESTAPASIERSMPMPGNDGGEVSASPACATCNDRGRVWEGADGNTKPCEACATWGVRIIPLRDGIGGPGWIHPYARMTRKRAEAVLAEFNKPDPDPRAIVVWRAEVRERTKSEGGAT